MRNTIIISFCMLFLGGCNGILGLEEDYVLREPITVQFGDQGESVTVPAGTHVKQTFFKDGQSFVEVYGMTNRRQLQEAGESPK